MSVREEVQRVLDAVARDPWHDFAARTEAMERLEVHVLDRLGPHDEGLRTAAETLRDRLHAANDRMLARLRRRIRAGCYTPRGLARAFARYAEPEGYAGYDVLDALVTGLLDVGALPDEQAAREPEMVAYQPTPGRAILTLIERAGIGPDDVVYDLGAGLGHVVLLVALLSTARARGVEFEPTYCTHALRCVEALNVRGVEILCADAREAPLTDGTVFFLYTPFRGAMLMQVLDRVQAEARTRPIRVCTYGPCTADVARVPWLRPRNRGAVGLHEVAVFDAG